VHQTMVELEAQVGGWAKINSLRVDGKNAGAEIQDGLVKQ